MHEALFCSELLDLISHNCSLHTISQLSLTNRTISDSVLHVLWSSIENFGPLIRCMPADLWEERPSESCRLLVRFYRLLPPTQINTFFQSFRRPIRDTDFERFLLRAVHVKSFGDLSGNTKYQVEAAALLALCCAAGKNIKLLPRLRRLAVTCTDQDLTCIGHCLSPTITQVDIYPSDKSLLSTLQTVILQCPLVTEACLVGSGPVSVLTRTVSLMHHWSHLQTLIVIHPVSVYGLSSLPALKNLALASAGRYASGPIPKISKGFSALEGLVLCDCHPDFCITFMRYMDQTPMKSISVLFQTSISLDVWFGFLNAMRDGVVHDQIQSVDLDCAYGQMFDQPCSVETISPLLCYTNLSSIRLKSLRGFKFDDGAIDAMASSWKELRKFKVETVWQPQPRATYKSLVSFARHNPRLEKLVILFDATTITKDILNARPWKGIRNQSLRTLDVRCSQIEAPDLVADFLTDIFPKLVWIDVSVDLDARAHAAQRNSSQLYCDRWTEVERLLRTNMGR